LGLLLLAAGCGQGYIFRVADELLDSQPEFFGSVGGVEAKTDDTAVVCDKMAKISFGLLTND
jgi:hypothetical protein